MTEPRYRWGMIPTPGRFPRSRRDWLRPAAVLLVAVLVVTGVMTAAPWLAARLSCRDGLPAGDVYAADGECVGITEGPYAFDIPEFEGVFGRIEAQNEAAAGACVEGREPVTVGVLMGLTHPNSGARALHELEGFAAGQRSANQPGCSRALRLRVGHTGSAEQAAVELAGRFREDSRIAAVVGLGLSGVNAAEAANLLGAEPDENGVHPVPMVADLITAEGFDSDGTPPAASCDEEATFTRGIGGNNNFFRVSFRNGLQVDELAEYLGTGNRPTFIVIPDDSRDPYTCTTLQPIRELYQQQQPQVPEVQFSVTNEATLGQVARRVCGAEGAVTVFYTARSRDLGRLLAGLAKRYDDGLCAAESVTVISTDDGVRMRVPEVDPVLEAPRSKALTSSPFADGRLRLIYTPLADPDALRRGEAGGGSEFTELERLFEEMSFDVAHLDDGWGINAYDAVYTVAKAVESLDSDRPVTRALVRGAIADFSAADVTSQVIGANGPIGFENNGNRVGTPVTVRLCPPDSEGRTHTVTQIGAPGDRTSC